MAIKLKYTGTRRLSICDYIFTTESPDAQTQEVSEEHAEWMLENYPSLFKVADVVKKPEPKPIPKVEKKEVKVESYETKDVKAPAKKKGKK